jgi:hypothetical protein
MSQRDDHRMALIQAFKRKDKKADSVNLARGDFKYLLRLSLNDLVKAGNMAIDQRLPECLSLFAKEITRTDGGVPFRPRLRRLAKSWLDDVDQAKEWFDYFDRSEEELDPYLKSILYPLLKTLIGEDDSETDAKDLSKRA